MIALRVLLVLAILAQLALATALWPELPERVPTHFDLAGCPDGWGERSVEWFVLAGLLGIAGAIAGFGMPWLNERLARRRSPWLNVPDRERFYALPEAERVAALRHTNGWLCAIGIELQALMAFLLLGTFRIAAGAWRCLPLEGTYGLLGLLLLTAVGLAIAGSRAVKRAVAGSEITS